MVAIQIVPFSFCLVEWKCLLGDLHVNGENWANVRSRASVCVFNFLSIVWRHFLISNCYYLLVVVVGSLSLVAMLVAHGCCALLTQWSFQAYFIAGVCWMVNNLYANFHDMSWWERCIRNYIVSWEANKHFTQIVNFAPLPLQ